MIPLLCPQLMVPGTTNSQVNQHPDRSGSRTLSPSCIMGICGPSPHRPHLPLSQLKEKISQEILKKRLPVKGSQLQRQWLPTDPWMRPQAVPAFWFQVSSEATGLMKNVPSTHIISCHWCRCQDWEQSQGGSLCESVRLQGGSV